jgi:HSP20 family protein
MAQGGAGEARWDPFSVMRGLSRFEPFRELELLLPAERAFLPAFDVRETKDAYIFQADLPGMREEDLEISLTGNHLTVSGKRQAEETKEDERYYCAERTYGSFVRSFMLPEASDPEQVKAEFKDGVLKVVIPKKPEMQPRKVPLGGRRPGGNGGGADSGRQQAKQP